MASRDDDALAAAAGLVRHLGRWSLVEPLLDGVTWAREPARAEVVAALRAAQEAGVVPAPRALAPLLRHPLWEVRTLALSLLRAGGRDLWATARAAGPAPGRSLPTDFAKPFIGVCEDAWEEAMGLAVEALLAHPSGEVARRALKLLNRRERHVATLALLLRLDDPELRQAALTTLSTWAGPALGAGGGGGAAQAEALEAARRELRATVEALATAPRAAAEPLLEAALASPVVFVRAAALGGRSAGPRRARADVLAALDPDPALALRRVDRGCPRRRPRRLAAPGGGRPRARAADAGARRRVRAAARRALARRLPAPAAPARGRSPARAQCGWSRRADRPPGGAQRWRSGAPGRPRPARARWVLAALERRLRAAGGPPPPAHALRGALGDPQPEVRQAALALVRADADGTLAESLGPTLGEALADPSVHVSGAAIEALATVTGAAETANEEEAEAGTEATTAEGEAPRAEDDLPASYGLADGEEDEDLPVSYGLGDGDDGDGDGDGGRG
ncbi:MAG: hypothetical protein KF878_23335 [Planctomycetes bacterium]|nr:hypothetical protein [Planctomycetota bacterium]